MMMKFITVLWDSNVYNSCKGETHNIFSKRGNFIYSFFMSMHGTGHYEDAADDAAPLLMPAELYRRHSVRQLQLQVAGGKIKLKR